MLSTEAAAGYFDLLERDAELGAIDALIGAAGPTGRLLAIEGPPGIGKTSLIAEAKLRAQAAGWRCSARAARNSSARSPTASSGSSTSSSSPDYLPRSEGLLFRLGGAREAALRARPAGGRTCGRRCRWHCFTACTGSRRTWPAAARLLAVDDLHWCDLPSLRWLAYLLPRMEGLNMMVLPGSASREGGEDPTVLAHIVADPRERPAACALERGGRRSVRERSARLRPGHRPATFACRQEAGGSAASARAMPVGRRAPRPNKGERPRAELGAQAGLRAVWLLSRMPGRPGSRAWRSSATTPIPLHGRARGPGRASGLRAGDLARS